VTSSGLGPVPIILGDWHFEAVKALCAAGYPESDRHDFKRNLPEPKGLTKLACAFANTFGGFIVLGVSETAKRSFEPEGIEPDGEIYGKFHAKIRAEPEIAVSYPRQIEVPNSKNVLYVLEVFQSTRRPHLSSPEDERYFWKRVGSSCRRMTLEEVRQQMLSLEEKREKLSLILIDLLQKRDHLKNNQMFQMVTTPATYFYSI
jgi:predicted HTH transcriptional regulator